MANVRKRILKELRDQEKTEGKTENIKLLRLFLSVVRTNLQWEVFVDCNHISTGTQSYQSKRFFYATEELRNLVEEIRDEF